MWLYEQYSTSQAFHFCKVDIFINGVAFIRRNSGVPTDVGNKVRRIILNIDAWVVKFSK